MNLSIKALRWEPTSGMPELPLSAFDLTWSNEGTLRCTGLYETALVDHFPAFISPSRAVVVEFPNVHSFLSFDEFADLSRAWGLRMPALRQSVPYGGCWPFAEIVGSPLVDEIVGRDGALKPSDLRHWLIVTADMTLHVLTQGKDQPTFGGWDNWPAS